MTDYATIDAARQRFEARLLPGVERALLSVGEEAASLLERGRDPEGAAIVDVAADVLAYVYTETVPPFADAALNALRPPIRSTHEVAPSWMERVRTFLLNEAAEMVRSITDTLRDEIRTVLRRGVEEGYSVSRMARSLREAWPDVARRRAEVIVRTEVLAASNWGSLEGAKRTAEQYGLELEKVWLATPDSRVRDSHSAADGQRRAMSAAFSVGGYAAQYPGDPALPASERVQCRCTVVYEPVERKGLSWTARRNEAMRALYESIKGEHPTWVQAVEAVQEEVEGADALAFETARRICHSKG